MGKAKVTEVHQHSETSVNPILIGWDHGTLKEELTSSAVCKVKKKPGSTLCSSVEVTIGGDTVYVGEIPQNPQCRTFIAIRSKNKKKPSHSKVKLYETSSTLLVEKKEESQNDNKFEEINKTDKFYKVFASKKGLRQHQNIQKMNIVSGSVRDNLKEQLNIIKVENEDGEIASGTSLVSILPPCNRNATLKEDVYSVESIIPDNIMLELESDAQFVMDNVKSSTSLSEEEYTSFFIQSVSEILKSSSVKIEPDVLKHRVKMLIFCELLLKLVNSKRKVVGSKFSLVSHLPVTNQYILDNYTANNLGKRLLTIESQDKVLCHVIILTLLSCCYVLNLKTLCSSVPFSADKINPMLHIVGLTPAPSTDKRLYVLKTPLPPLPTMGGKRGRGLKRKRQ
ncbi:uncharacterized protein LOC103505494 [Diaphorina citri]|uniref:Uncharacterized protein LOC103505494 n=1 Tax=Diaphorina citri TaxID=121845 RepID=A0A3Q0IK59_DIACI|nr:uncharacterized protein LOC103505494 [Diaphorina citri]KAI5746956.1 hypothetical protein M8J77_009521 [Diaphorina citri]